MARDSAAPATAGQIQYVMKIFRGLHPDCPDDAALVKVIKEQTGYDVESLDHARVQEIVAKFAPASPRTKINSNWSKQLQRRNT